MPLRLTAITLSHSSVGHRVDVADLAHAGAVDEHVDPALRRDDLGDRALDVGGDAHVAVNAASPARSKPVARAPSRAKRSAISRPIPLAAPVTSTTRFSSIRPPPKYVNPMSAWTIDGPRHGGITVSDLDRSLDFYCGLLGLELLWRRLYEEREITRIVGVPEATGFEIAMLRVPGSDVDVELIEYHGCERPSGSSPPCDYGTGHFCVFVTRHRRALRGAARARRRVPLRRAGRDERRRERAAARASTRSIPTATSSSSTSGRPDDDGGADVAERPADGRCSSSTG